MNDPLPAIIGPACLCVALLLSACAGGGARHVPAEPTLAGTAWVLSSLPGSAGGASGPVTLRFEGGLAQGSDGCNRYRAAYRAGGGGALEVGTQQASTRMACPPPVMRRARSYGVALASARTYRLDGERLTLVGPDGAVLATFTAQSRALAGTAWRVSGYNTGRAAVVGPLAGTRLSVRFDASGRLGGHAGCNRYGAAYSVDGTAIRIDAPVATRMACPRPQGVMAQERAFLAALPSAATLRFEGERLELRTAQGALAVGLVREHR